MYNWERAIWLELVILKVKKIDKKVDLLGREGSKNSLQIQIFDDGSIKKMLYNKK